MSEKRITVAEIAEILKIEREVLWNDKIRRDMQGPSVVASEDEILTDLASGIARKLREKHRYTAKTVYQCADCGTTTSNRESHNAAHAAGMYGEER